jgi:hypothetical protein
MIRWLNRYIQGLTNHVPVSIAKRDRTLPAPNWHVWLALPQLIWYRGTSYQLSDFDRLPAVSLPRFHDTH